MRIYEYVLRRLALVVFVLFGVSAIVFYLARGFPSAFTPWAQYVTFRMRPDQIEAVIKAHGFDKPLYIQYWYWLVDVFHGDWGYSNWANGLPTYKVFASRFPFTVELTVAATIMTVAIGIPLGILSALKNNTAADHASRIIALTGYSTPAYWFAYILQLVFFYYFYVWGLPNLPSGGAISQGLATAVPAITGMPIVDGLLAGNLAYAADAFAHVILPAFSLSFISLGYLARIVRASMLEVLRQDYIIMARSKGLPERVVIYRHALRNALIPAMTLTGLFFAGLLGGAIITETVFSWPGVGYVRLARTEVGEVLKTRVYNDLYTFFQRYYDNGDYVSKRRNRNGTYAIPYDGREVIFHWANRDQYYAKSGEWLKAYRFNIKGYRVAFEIREPAKCR